MKEALEKEGNLEFKETLTLGGEGCSYRSEIYLNP